MSQRGSSARDPGVLAIVESCYQRVACSGRLVLTTYYMVSLSNSQDMILCFPCSSQGVAIGCEEVSAGLGPWCLRGAKAPLLHTVKSYQYYKSHMVRGPVTDFIIALGGINGQLKTSTSNLNCKWRFTSQTCCDQLMRQLF